MRADAPALAMMRTCMLKNFVTSKEKNAFTFTGTAVVRSALQTFFNIKIFRISYYDGWYNEKYNFSLRILFMECIGRAIFTPWYLFFATKITLEFLNISHVGSLTDPGEEFLQTYIPQDFKKKSFFQHIVKFDKQCQSHIGKLDKQYA